MSSVGSRRPVRWVYPWVCDSQPSERGASRADSYEWTGSGLPLDRGSGFPSGCCAGRMNVEQRAGSTAQSPTWCWHPVDANRPSVSGDLAKVFRNESVKAPGVLGRAKPADAAALLAREAIQNA